MDSLTGLVGPTVAEQFFEKSKNLDDAPAFFISALMHEQGEGGRVNYEAAASLYLEAHAHGANYPELRAEAERLLQAIMDKLSPASQLSIRLYLNLMPTHISFMTFFQGPNNAGVADKPVAAGSEDEHTWEPAERGIHLLRL